MDKFQSCLLDSVLKWLLHWHWVNLEEERTEEKRGKDTNFSADWNSLSVFPATVAGVDPQDPAMAGEPHHGQHLAWHPPQAGRVSWLPPQAQAPKAGGQGEAGELFQHTTDPPAPLQPPRLPPHWGKNGFGEFGLPVWVRGFVLVCLLGASVVWIHFGLSCWTVAWRGYYVILVGTKGLYNW